MKMAVTTNSHIGIISRLIILLWGYCGLFHQYVFKVERATIKSIQVVLKVAFPFNIWCDMRRHSDSYSAVYLFADRSPRRSLSPRRSHSPPAVRSRSPLDLLATLDAKPGSNNSASGVSKPKRCRDYDGMYHTGFPMCIGWSKKWHNI